MKDNVKKPEYMGVLRNQGIANFSRNELPLTEADWQIITNLSDKIQYHKVMLSDAGDKHCTYVARLAYDQYENFHPKIMHKGMHDIKKILLSSAFKKFYQQVLGSDNLIIPRCQYNILKEGGFLSRHIDAESNPNCYITAILYLPSDFIGGELVYEFNQQTQTYKPEEYSMLFLRSLDVAHSVNEVMAGTRKALVYFLTLPYVDF